MQFAASHQAPGDVGRLQRRAFECPVSANARSVAAASRASASTAGETPVAIAVSSVRSAASRWCTVVQRRSQRLSVTGSGWLPSGARSRRGASSSQSPPHGARHGTGRDRLPLLAAGRRLASAVRIVRPTSQPSRFCAPNSATWRTISANGTSAASCPCTALAMTSPRSWARPSASR